MLFFHFANSSYSRALRNRTSFSLACLCFCWMTNALGINWNETQPTYLSYFTDCSTFSALRNIFKSPEKSTYKYKQGSNGKRMVTNAKMGLVSTARQKCLPSTKRWLIVSWFFLLPEWEVFYLSYRQTRDCAAIYSKDSSSRMR